MMFTDVNKLIEKYKTNPDATDLKNSLDKVMALATKDALKDLQDEYQALGERISHITTLEAANYIAKDLHLIYRDLGRP